MAVSLLCQNGCGRDCGKGAVVAMACVLAWAIHFLGLHIFTSEPA